MQRLDLNSSHFESLVENSQPKANLIQQDPNFLSMSAFQSEVIQNRNEYLEVKVSGPKWSKEGG